MPEIGLAGQERLRGARVLLVGAGGLVSPAALYLAAAGVGTLGIVDSDVVDASNLQRQILHATADTGRPKVESAKHRVRAINPNVSVEMHHARLSSENAMRILERYDVVLDGADNFPTRYLVNDACVLLGKPNAFGAIFRFEGQASVFGAKAGPCYRCVYPEPPPPGLVPSCAEAGVFGILPGVIGTILATETIKLILGVGETLVGRLLVYDAMRMAFRELQVPKDPDCPVCGAHGVVYSAEDTRQSRPVTFVVLPKAVALNRKAMQRFQACLTTSTALSHPNFCDVYEIGRHEDHPFIVMELLEGQTLGRRIAERPLHIEEILDLGSQVLEALEAAHAKGVIYRDITPANIFITRHGTVKLLDLELAKLIENRPPVVTKEGSVLGNRGNPIGRGMRLPRSGIHVA